MLIVAASMFNSARAQNYLSTALQAENWIASAELKTKDGIQWKVIPDAQNTSIETNLYKGSSGIILLYLELYKSTKQQRYLAKIEQAANELIAGQYTQNRNQAFTLYYGIAGNGFILNEIYKVTNNKRYLKAALKIVDILSDSAIIDHDKANWGSNNAISMGTAGTGAFLLYADRELHHPKAKELAKKVGNYLIANAIKTPAGNNWVMVPDTLKSPIMPNFAYGAAGISYFLLQLYEQTGQQLYLDEALKGVSFLNSISNEQGLIYHHSPDGKNLFYYGFCQGPAGTTHLYKKLYDVTKDEQYQQKIKLLANTMLNKDLFDKNDKGIWNNVGQCCGTSGIGDYYLYLYHTYNDPRYLDAAKALAAHLIEHSSTDAHGIKWVQAESRARPNDLVAQTGYMQGAAGVASFLIHLDGAIKGNLKFYNLPDNPFVN